MGEGGEIRKEGEVGKGVRGRVSEEVGCEEEK